MNNKELPFIKDMFDKIAPRYDFLNRFLSLKQDVYWRREMVEAMRVPDKAKVLDVACGTGDVAVEILKQKGSGVKILGADFSPGMLVLAQKKIREKGLQKNIKLLAGNALSLPFPKETFHAVTIAFGIRNIADRFQALESFYGSLKPGGKVVVLELTTPETGFFRDLYLFYFQKVLPMIGGLFSKNFHAYSYLPDSVLKFPDSKEFAKIMRSAGFEKIRWKHMTLGIVTLFVGEKPKS